MLDCFRVRSRRGYLSVGASVVAMVAASPAVAQCVPDPTIANGSTACSGVDGDGLRIVTNFTRVDVEAGAVVERAGGAAITVDVPADTYSYYARSTSIDVAGTVAGISVLSGSAAGFDSYGSTAAITVAASGSVGGVAVGASAGNAYGHAVATIDNSGTIVGTGADGLALRTASPRLAGFNRITNRAGAAMGAISAPVGALANAGTIDGGSMSAVAQPGTYIWSIQQGAWSNSGTIRSSGTAATILGISTQQALTNSGTIANAGTGAALQASGIALTNTATGLVGSAGTLAIDAATYLNLTNGGRIEGSVRAGGTPQPLGSGSYVDSSAGTITGDLILGATNDTVAGRYVGTVNLETGVQGTLDAGGGIDTLQLRATADTRIDTAIALLPSFERLAIDVASGTTTTLGAAFVSPGTLTVTGRGSLVNQGTIAGAGEALIANDFSSFPSIVNQGVIRTTSGRADQFGVTLGSANFTNEGNVVTAGAGVNISSNGSFANAGRITSVGTAVSLFGSSFSNTGEIRSTGGTGLVLRSANGASTPQNSGSIEGPVTGVSLSGWLINTGTISSAQTGVVLSSYSMLDNRASGTISGGTAAIGPGSDALGPGFNQVVLNAGTIRGTVDFVGPRPSNFASDNRYFALPGGVLDGDLKLSAGNFLVTQAINTGPGQFAGINGTVTANNANLRYQVRSDAALTHAAPAGFATVGYELFDGAKLTLTGAGNAAPPVILAGTGSVDMSVNVTANAQPAIQHTSLLTGNGYSGEAGTLDIVSRGTLSLTRRDANGGYGLVWLATGDTFENAGTIEVRDASTGAYSPAAAIIGGNAVNSGTIALSAAVGVSGAASFTNTGSIVQIAGGAAATGVLDVAAIVNSGTISLDGPAIGRSQNFYASTNVINATSGVLASSSGTAVAISGGTVANAGSVIGTVDLGYQFNYYSSSTPIRSNNSGTYIAQGGTVTGDILFGNGSDVFIATNGETGVSGIIDGGQGDDVFGYVLDHSGTVAPGTNPQVRNFEGVLLQARGAETVITLAGTNPVTGALYLGGDGAVVNQATIATRATSGLPYPLTTSDYASGLARFENQGTLQSGISGQIASFANSGTIGQYTGLYAAYSPGVDLYSPGTLDFANSGRVDTIVALSATDDVSVVNSGTIRAGSTYRDAFQPSALSIGLQGEEAASVSIVNSGTISADLPASSRRLFTSGVYVSSEGPTAIALTNAADGTISATGDLAFGVVAFNGSLTLDNAGTIRGGTIDANGTTGAAVAVSGEDASLIRNSGTLDGAVLLGSGADRVENRGTITGPVVLGAGDDTFIQRAGATLAAYVDGSDGFDSFIVDATGSMSLSATQLVGFETLTQIGTGTASYTGAFELGTIALQGGTLAVAAGQALSTTGSDTVTGGAAGVTLQNAGTIAGGLLLGGGRDTVRNAGIIAGAVRLGAGDDTYVDLAGSKVSSVDGGAGSDLLVLDVTGGRSLSPGTFTSFERLATQGNGTLMLANGAFAYDRVDIASALAVAANASLRTAGQLSLGGGLSTISGTAILGGLSLTGGRLVGLAGSTITAPTISVGTGAVFGSAGTVNGNIAVAGTLSPGASPGTMTVNGNLALAGSSVSVFEITPTVSDKLVVNGQVTIAQGATLQIVAADAVRPGQSVDLIVASGGIAGSYTNVVKPASLLGFLVQQDGRLTLRGEFASDTGFAPGVQSTIGYVNALLRGGGASPAVLAALPTLLTQGGASNAAAFARLAPEAYASATQIAVEHGLELAGVARGDAFAAPAPGAFTFASALGNVRTLQTGGGASDAKMAGYGMVGGIGLAGESGAIGAFVGYLDSNQRLGRLGARTDADGVVAGIHGRWSNGQLGIKATLAYDDGRAKTTRVIAGGTALGRYDLHGWMADAAIDATVPLSGNWTVRPSLGVTAIRVTRGAVAETGSSAFVLDVARNRDRAAFVDGALTFAGGQREGSALRPYLSVGLRYQFDGRTPQALAALDSGAFGLSASGVSRAPVVASAALGWDIAVSSRFAVFAAASGESGDADHRFSSQGGVRLAF